jgi:hypothetical protein
MVHFMRLKLSCLTPLVLLSEKYNNIVLQNIQNRQSHYLSVYRLGTESQKIVNRVQR